MSDLIGSPRKEALTKSKTRNNTEEKKIFGIHCENTVATGEDAGIFSFSHNIL